VRLAIGWVSTTRRCRRGEDGAHGRHAPAQSEPPPGPPQIQFKPGIAQETLRELAPLLAEEGIDVDNIDVPDLETLRAALNRAVERHNMIRFTPVGHARQLVITTLRLVIEAIAEGDTTLAASILQHVQPESPDNTAATVAGCIGVALGLLDDWLTRSDPHPPKNFGQRVRLPSGHWLGEHAATDILVLARKGRAFSSLNTLISRQGGEHVLYGSALALAATLQTWATDTDKPVLDLVRAACADPPTLSNIIHRVATMAGIRLTTSGARSLDDSAADRSINCCVLVGCS
jgi:hypothetical protein